MGPVAGDLRDVAGDVPQARGDGDCHLLGRRERGWGFLAGGRRRKQKKVMADEEITVPMGVIYSPK